MQRDLHPSVKYPFFETFFRVFRHVDVNFSSNDNYDR